MQQVYEVTNDEYKITTNIAKLDVDVIHSYLCNESYWAQGIPKHVVEKAIANSLCFGLFYKDEQIGFARLVTDEATFAYLADVFIIEVHRGKGLSKWLMQTIHAHPELQHLRRWMLVTKDAQELYKQFGWSQIPADVVNRFMTIHNAEVYKKSESR